MGFDESAITDRNIFFQKDRPEFRVVALHGTVNAFQHLVFGHADAGAEYRGRLFDRMRAVLANQNDVIRRAVVGKDPMLAVIDAAPGSGERNFPNTILFGALLVIAEL